jgi:hypothetical protein
LVYPFGFMNSGRMLSHAMKQRAHMEKPIGNTPCKRLIGNYNPGAGAADILRPYEAAAYLPG